MLQSGKRGSLTAFLRHVAVIKFSVQNYMFSMFYWVQNLDSWDLQIITFYSYLHLQSIKLIKNWGCIFVSRYCTLYCTKFCCLIDFLKKNHFAGYQKHATIKTQCTWIIHTMMDSSAYINVTCPLLSQFFSPLRGCCEMLCLFQNSLASLVGKIRWITQTEMQLPPPCRILITEPWC